MKEDLGYFVKLEVLPNHIQGFSTTVRQLLVPWKRRKEKTSMFATTVILYYVLKSQNTIF